MITVGLSIIRAFTTYQRPSTSVLFSIASGVVSIAFVDVDLVVAAESRIALNTTSTAESNSQDSSAKSVNRRVAADDELEVHIAEWIAALGHEQYAMRKQAQVELEKIGVPALDQLQQAVLNEDPQIAAAAKFIMRSSYIRWTGREDPMQVRKLLQEYGTGDLVYRAERIRKLAQLNDDLGLAALLRISRYETSVDLSKRAAIEVMQKMHLPPITQVTIEGTLPTKDLQAMAKLVIESMGSSKSTSAKWLNNFSESILESVPIDVGWWQAAIDMELELVDKKSGESSRDITNDLIRFIAERVAQQGASESGLKLATNLMRLKFSLREQAVAVEDLYRWALDTNFPQLVDNHAKSFEQHDSPKPRIEPGKDPFWQDRGWSPTNFKFLYLHGEALKKLNRMEEAQSRANEAYEQKSPNREYSTFARYYRAEYLRDRSLHDWAEREYRQALETGSPEQPRLIVDYSERLADLLADGEKYKDAADVLGKIVKRLESDPDFAREIDLIGSRGISFLPEAASIASSDRLKSRYLYVNSLANIDAGQFDLAWSELQESLQKDPENIDCIIAMYRLPDIHNRHDTIDAICERKLTEIRDALPNLERTYRTSSPNEAASYKYNYGGALNTLAWLLVSTGREKPYALQCSQLACRLVADDAATLDTLAKCYFENGEITKAILVERKASALKPSSREVLRTLQLFEASAK